VTFGIVKPKRYLPGTRVRFSKFGLNYIQGKDKLMELTILMGSGPIVRTEFFKTVTSTARLKMPAGFVAYNSER
jgi:hypothetical protein